MSDKPCWIEGCTGEHTERAGPGWGELEGTIMHRVLVDEGTTAGRQVQP